MRCHQHSDGLLRDYCDGSAYKPHAVFSQNHQGLQMIAYYDDVEVCNPLGSKAKKHKLGECGYNLSYGLHFSSATTTNLLFVFLNWYARTRTTTCSSVLLYTWEHFTAVPVDHEVRSTVNHYKVFCTSDIWYKLCTWEFHEEHQAAWAGKNMHRNA